MAEEKRRVGKLLPGVWRGDFHRWKGSKFRPVIIVMSEFEQKLDFPCSQNNNNPTLFPSGSPTIPVKVTVDEAKTAFLCGCKQSKNGVYCDGTHKGL